MFKQTSHESEGCAAPHIPFLYIRIKVLLTKPTEGRCEYSCYKKKSIFQQNWYLTYCNEKGLEDYVIQLETKAPNLVTLSLYGAPSGDFNHFMAFELYS